MNYLQRGDPALVRAAKLGLMSSRRGRSKSSVHKLFCACCSSVGWPAMLCPLLVLMMNQGSEIFLETRNV